MPEKNGLPMKLFRLFIVFSLALAPYACNTAWAGPFDFEDPLPFSFGGYSSAGFQIHPGGDKEARLHQYSVILNWDNKDRLHLFGEFELENPLSWEEGGAPPNTGEARLDVERLYADYALNSRANLRGGRFLTPIGRWNVIHAAPLVWTTTRPGATERLFPMSINGAMLHGAVPWGDNALEYSAYAELLRDQSHDENEIDFSNARGLRLNYTGAFEVGVNLSEFEENENLLGDPRYRMLGVDFVKAWNGWEISAEVYQRDRRDEGGSTGGGYLQTVAPLGNQWYAIARLENLREEERGTTGRWLVGAAWRYTTDRVIKLEYVGGRDEHPDMPRGFIASFAILF